MTMQRDYGDECGCEACAGQYLFGRPVIVSLTDGSEGTQKRNTAGERLIRSALQAAGIARELPMPKYWYQSEFPAVQPEEGKRS